MTYWPTWTEQAACTSTDPEVFFQDHLVPQAKRICSGCPVNARCLKENMRTPFGVFGGLTSVERGFIKGRLTK